MVPPRPICIFEQTLKKQKIQFTHSPSSKKICSRMTCILLLFICTCKINWSKKKKNGNDKTYTDIYMQLCTYILDKTRIKSQTTSPQKYGKISSLTIVFFHIHQTYCKNSHFLVNRPTISLIRKQILVCLCTSRKHHTFFCPFWKTFINEIGNSQFSTQKVTKLVMTPSYQPTAVALDSASPWRQFPFLLMVVAQSIAFLTYFLLFLTTESVTVQVGIGFLEVGTIMLTLGR